MRPGVSNPRMGIDIQGLGVEYRSASGDHVLAMQDVSLNISENEFIAVVGPSGCGKTTLLRVLSGLLHQTTGTILRHGQPYSGDRSEVGVVFQEARLLPWLTVLGNVLLPVTVQGRDRTTYRDRAMALLELVGLAAFAHRYPGELSGGMQQRVAICRALVHEPSLLLMDEPFGALDAMTRETMNQELLNIWQTAPKTVVFITHSIPEAVFLADRVAVFTPRPGRMRDIVTVDLPRDRDLSIMAHPGFVSLTSDLRAMFNSSSNFF